MQIAKKYLNLRIMTLSELKLKLHKKIESISDVDKLHALNIFLERDLRTFPAMSVEDYIRAIDEARLQIERGNFASVDDVEKQSENW